MSESLASTSRLRGPPATLEAMALFRVKAAAGLHGPPAPASTPNDQQVVVVTREDGGIVVYPASPKLVILAAERNRLRDTPAFTF
ncbi:MAG TPA: hypothetical protein VG943_13845 [Caulobacterales bacterium]|nr:hypothetical protein [Caulobacterales bacterium]